MIRKSKIENRDKYWISPREDIFLAVFALVLCTRPGNLPFAGAFLQEYIWVRLRLTNILSNSRVKADAIMQKSEMYKEKELNKVYSTKAIKGMYKCN